MKYYILYNPKAGNGSAKEDALKLAEKLNCTDVDYMDVTTNIDYSTFVPVLREDDVLVIMGGDGTLNHFVNATKDVDIKQEVLYCSGGTGNDFLRDIDKEVGCDPFSIKKYIERLPTVTINGNTYKNAVTKEDCGFPFYLYQFNSAGAFYSEKAAPQRLYGFKMWHGETLVADMLPARKDGVCCLFDKVTQTFFYNIGSGEFIAGPRVCLVKDWMLVEYEGVNDGEVEFSADSVNEGLDREISVSFVDKSRTIVVERTVRQEGLREVFMASDGDFLLADSGTLNVLKS